MTNKLWIASLVLGVAAFGQAPVLRPGISVEMAVTSAASLRVEADQAGALIVAVTRSGDLYLDAASITSAALAEELRRAGTGKVYVKADTRAPYSDVVTVLVALRNAGESNAILLTSQRDAAVRGYTPPKGLEVSIGGPRDARERVVGLEPAGPMAFGDVVRIVDAARSSGIKTFLVMR